MYEAASRTSHLDCSPIKEAFIGSRLIEKVTLPRNRRGVFFSEFTESLQGGNKEITGGSYYFEQIRKKGAIGRLNLNSSSPCADEGHHKLTKDNMKGNL